MPGRLNIYGDRLRPTSGAHGGDITSQRLDELDRLCLAAAIRLGPTEAWSMDLGCGFGAQGMRFALLGLNALLVDQIAPSGLVRSFAEPHEFRIRLTYIQTKAQVLVNWRAHFTPLNLIYSQRFIHYLTFSESHDLMSLLRTACLPGTRLFISASGLHSELGRSYPARNQHIEERYAHLSSAARRKHGIEAQVCLYAEEDLAGLMRSSGFRKLKLWTSPFGNVKGVFRAP
jgi:hypothetical protein